MLVALAVLTEEGTQTGNLFKLLGDPLIHSLIHLHLRYPSYVIVPGLLETITISLRGINLTLLIDIILSAVML